MQEKILYEYAVIRLVPKVEREEFINVGVVLYSATTKFLEATFVLNVPKLSAFSSHCDVELAEKYLQAFVRICAGNDPSSPISKLPAPTRFRWLTATRSTVIQTSKVHSGFCKDPAKKLEELVEQLVRS